MSNILIVHTDEAVTSCRLVDEGDRDVESGSLGKAEWQHVSDHQADDVELALLDQSTEVFVVFGLLEVVKSNEDADS